MSETTTPRGRTAGDWAGFAAFLALACWLFATSASLGLLMLPTVLHELGISLTYLVRGRPRAVAPGWRPRVVALACSFLMLAFTSGASLIDGNWVAASASVALQDTGFMLWLVGALLGLLPLYHLRGSFSLIPQARALVTGGAYRWARHPIYALYLLQYTGIWLGHLTPQFTAVMVVYLVLLRIRIGYEEAVLESAFPEYREYRARVGAFGPRLSLLFRRRPATLAA
ncbi:MAG TPA: isoprenylcysteine carboxylmethyltransferase family protein [Longimicrobium sp.]|nr:isoprenylcysteine carboxylmethyltransferase family protein [Longimicrobium sp.]